MARKYQRLNNRSKPILPKVNNIVGIISGIITTIQFIVLLSWRSTRAYLENFSHTNSFFAVLILSSLVLWLFCFYVMSYLSERYRSKYFNGINIFAPYRKFKTSSIIASIVMGLVFLGLEAILADYFIPKKIFIALAFSLTYWILMVIIWYKGFIWYRQSKNR